jgi:hypothetical protein
VLTDRNPNISRDDSLALLLSWGAGEKHEPDLDVATDEISCQEADDSKPERATVEESVEVSRKRKQAALIMVLLAMFALAIVLLCWRGVLSTFAMMIMSREQERYGNEHEY